MKTRAAILTIILALLLSAPAAGSDALGDYRYTVSPSGGATITRYRGSEAELTIPDELGGHPVTAIGKGAFSQNKTIKSVVIPDSVVSIEDFAFEQCRAIKSVSIGAGVELMGENPFYWCVSLKSIELLPGNRSLAVKDHALFFEPEARLVTYLGGHDASEYAVPDGTEIIGAGAFAGCSALTSVTIPDSVRVLGDAAFLYCEGLEYADIGRGVELLGPNPFAACKSLGAVRVADDHPTLEVIDGALILKRDMKLISHFRADKSRRYDVPEGIRIIGETAFFDCGGVSEINLPDSVVKIDTGAFMLCGALRSVTLPEGMIRIENVAFAGCYALKTLTLSEKLVYIAPDAFDYCSVLTLTVTPDSYAARFADVAGIPYIYAEPGGHKEG